jgi:hypothetical protein
LDRRNEFAIQIFGSVARRFDIRIRYAVVCASGQLGKLSLSAILTSRIDRCSQNSANYGTYQSANPPCFPGSFPRLQLQNQPFMELKIE